MVHLESRWESPNKQQDVCHLLMHLSHAFPENVTECSWRTVAGVLPVDRGNLWPLPLALPQHSCCVQDLLCTWHSKGYALSRRPHLVSLQLQRFNNQEGSLVRNKAVIGLDQVVSFDVIDGPPVCLYLGAVVVDFGPSVNAGHYRTLLYPSMLYTNDGVVGALKVTQAQLQEVQANSYLLFYHS